MLCFFKELYRLKIRILFLIVLRDISAIWLIAIFITAPSLIFSQSIPDSTVYKKTIFKLSQISGFTIKSDKIYIQQVRLNNNKFEQCVSISSVRKNGVTKKILIFWQRDANGKWSDTSYIFANRFKFIDIENNGIQEIECTDKKSDKNHREKRYRLISFVDGQQSEMYAYHQFEYFNVRYIQSNIAPDSVFAVNHNMKIKDIDWDGKPEITDKIEIKYRKLPCCDHHFEYGIRQKKLVLYLINGKFESE